MKGFFKILIFVALLFRSISGCGSELSEIHLKKDSVAGYLHIPRDRSIDNSTYLYVKYALEFFREHKVSFVVLDLNTPGGEVFAALRIAEELRNMDEKYEIPVIAYIDSWALSAGALLAYSCRFIGTVPDGSMGAAEPVIVSQEGKMETASEKMVSALRVEFAKAAERYGRNPLLAEAMVDKDVVLVFRKGSIVKLLDDSQILAKDVVINAKGKLLTLNAKQMQEWQVADFISSSFETAPFLNGVKAELLSYENWKIDFFAFLSHPWVSSLLMMGLMICLYAEFQHPSLGFFAILGAGCLSLVLLSAFSTEMIHWLELFFLLAGLCLFIGDLFFFSGFGFLGVIGLLLFFFGLVAMLLPPLQGFSLDPTQWGIWMTHWIDRLALFLCVFLLFFIVVLPLGGFFFRRSRPFKKLVLEEAKTECIQEDLPSLGSKGFCFSALRPFGKVEINDKLYEAETEGEFLEPKTPIEIISYLGKTLVVRKFS